MPIAADQFIKQVQVLAAKGLNVLVTCKVDSLPPDLREELPLAIENLGHLILIGSGGPLLWTYLKSPHIHENHPIDTYVGECVNNFAHTVFGDQAPVILYPRSDLVFPLQQLGHILGLTKKSPLGIDLHPDFGLWFAYRALLWTSEDVPMINPPAWSSPCETCVDKPCVSNCPSQAVTVQSFNIKNCANYRLLANSSCANRCLSRLACPFHAEQRYSDEQIRYHMTQPEVLSFLARYK